MPRESGSFSTRVSSNISPTTVRYWMNGPTGIITMRVNFMMDAAIFYAINSAPVNNPLNARHRGGVVGTYRAGLRAQRTGNQYGRGFRLTASAAHSQIIEDGRRAATREQFFSWTRANPPGSMRWYTRTGARRGRKVLFNAAERGVRSVTGVQ